MNNVIKAMALICVTLVLMIGLITIQTTVDSYSWNNGLCACGGEWKFANAEHLKNGSNLYFYNCSECGNVIEIHVPQINKSSTREVAATVQEVNTQANCTTFVDWDGEEWIYNCTDYPVNKLVFLVFDDMGTLSILDDKIIEIRG